MRVLLCGESWVTHSLHIKGVDSFTTSAYVEGASQLRAALSGAGIDVDYLPGHLVPGQFPGSADALARYDAVILSDIGAKQPAAVAGCVRALHPRAEPARGRGGYVRGGGGLLMIGGYLSFAGIEGKARYHGTPVEDVLPVTIGETDDRVEAPQGVVPTAGRPDHPVLAGLPATWPRLLGYNRVTPKPTAAVVVSCGDDPLIACGEHHGGRGAVFTSDCAPHWGPPEFMAWPGYAPLWVNLVSWLARQA